MRKWFILAATWSYANLLTATPIPPSISDAEYFSDSEFIREYAEENQYNVSMLWIHFSATEKMAGMGISAERAKDTETVEALLDEKETLSSVIGIDVETRAVRGADAGDKGEVLYRSIVRGKREKSENNEVLTFHSLIRVDDEKPFPPCEYIRAHIRVISAYNERVHHGEFPNMRVGECSDDHFEIEHVSRDMLTHKGE